MHSTRFLEASCKNSGSNLQGFFYHPVRIPETSRKNHGRIPEESCWHPGKIQKAFRKISGRTLQKFNSSIPERKRVQETPVGIRQYARLNPIELQTKASIIADGIWKNSTRSSKEFQKDLRNNPDEVNKYPTSPEAS